MACLVPPACYRQKPEQRQKQRQKPPHILQRMPCNGIAIRSALRDSSPAALNDRPENPPKWYHIDCYLGVVCNDRTQGLALCSLPRKCMAQCRAGLVFDKLNIAPLGMLNQRESPPRKSMAW